MQKTGRTHLAHSQYPGKTGQGRPSYTKSLAFCEDRPMRCLSGYPVDIFSAFYYSDVVSLNSPLEHVWGDTGTLIPDARTRTESSHSVRPLQPNGLVLSTCLITSSVTHPVRQGRIH